ncbi:MAG: putative aldo/keto reductase [Clostridiaceae bacterium]|nr:putative aldo/keto reductase [Clostridiaceae bacterium]
MKYRKFGKTDFITSALGFGCMRLPVINGDHGKIDEENSIKLIRYGIDNGINYIDTAYPYHNGMSEILVGKALKDGYREKVKLATKMPVWLMEKYEDFDKYFNEQLEKLDTEYVDLYLLHALNKERIDKVVSLGVLEFLNEKVRQGKIKYVGFSFHDKLDVFKEIVDLYPWDFCQIQYNMLDENYQAGMKGLKYAASKGLAVVIMEPLRGGLLAKTPSKEIMDVFKDGDENKSPAAWALSWILNQPEVSVILSGMNDINQIKENIDTANTVEANSLCDKELNTMENVKSMFKKKMKVGCTACEYCMPCTVGINIPKNFSLYNFSSMYDDLESYSNQYNSLDSKLKASACIECGKCEKACPQHLPIRSLLKEVNKALGR